MPDWRDDPEIEAMIEQRVAERAEYAAVAWRFRLIGSPAVIYALWLGVVCLGPMIADAGFDLSCRLGPAAARPAEGEAA